MTLHDTIVLFSWRTTTDYEVVEMAGWHKVIYPKGFIKTSQDIHESDKHREVLIIDQHTIYII